MTGWRPIAEAQSITLGTVADIRMPSGRVYRATWRANGRCRAWWPDDARRRSPIGLYDPEAFRIIAIGIVPDRYVPRQRGAA